jgi:hypothetical protein
MVDGITIGRWPHINDPFNSWCSRHKREDK